MGVQERGRSESTQSIETGEDFIEDDRKAGPSRRLCCGGLYGRAKKMRRFPDHVDESLLVERIPELS
jgi:hypothetical protein